MKTYIKIFFFFLFINTFSSPVMSSETIKIGLVVPLSGEFSSIGNSIIKSMRLAINKIDNTKIEILPRDNKSDPNTTFEVSKKLYEKHNVKIIIGPVFSKNNVYLNKLPDVTFLSFTNRVTESYPNVISSGVNAISQIKAIKKYQKYKSLKRTILLIPNSGFEDEVEKAIKKTKIKLKDKYYYDRDPTLLTSQIEKITRYSRRKQNLIDEIIRLENSNQIDKDIKIEKLKKKDTLGGINFDSVIIADFDENLKSVTTSLLYTDISSKRVEYITLNQWFDTSLLNETSLQPLYFPSINKENYDDFINEYKNNFNDIPNQISFLSYDLLGLTYYIALKNDFVIDNKLFYKKNRFKGKIGVFEIKNNTITHELSFYKIANGEFTKIF
ncbi:MAG: hypothetical protein CMI86_00885 [Candidatus Pelagibacter sp.]|nr:hypothetical protein [Candidatus Pelagibacter sp.]